MVELIEITYQPQEGNWKKVDYFFTKEEAIQGMQQVMGLTMRTVLPVKARRILHVAENGTEVEEPLFIKLSVELQELKLAT